jgi:hypothetical protein
MRSLSTRLFSTAWIAALALVLVCGLAGVAAAQDDEAAQEATEEAAEAADDAAEATEEAGEEVEEAAEETEGGFFSDYGTDFKNTFLGGLNGLITFPADPVALAINPTDDMKSLPGGVVTGPVTGFFAGTLQGAYRYMGGSLDLLLAPFYVFPMFSPEPRYKVIPGWEHGG